MKCAMRLQVLVAIAALLMSMPTAYAVSDGPSDTLATPESFAAISDTAARSAALFAEVGKVLTHPRCVNCHPAGDRPRQTDVGRLHQPPVERGPDGLGLPGNALPHLPPAGQFRTRPRAGQPRREESGDKELVNGAAARHGIERFAGVYQTRSLPLCAAVPHAGKSRSRDRLRGWAYRMQPQDRHRAGPRLSRPAQHRHGHARRLTAEAAGRSRSSTFVPALAQVNDQGATIRRIDELRRIRSDQL
jgi:hypothetical protein